MDLCSQIVHRILFFELELSSTTTVMETESSKASVVPSTHGKDSSGTAAAIAIECQATGIYTVADPNECHTYYQCDRGVRTKLTCPEKHLYDTEKNQCMEYERVFCGTRTVNLAEKNQCKLFEKKYRATNE